MTTGPFKMFRPTRVWFLVCSLCVAIAAAAAVHVWRARDPLKSLRLQRRVIEARVSAFEYVAGPRRSDTGLLPDDAAIRDLQQRLKRARTPRNIHHYALAQLAAGRTHAARDLLAEASGLAPTDPEILADLAAVEMTLGRIAEAAELAARALRLDARNQAAAFNWALAIERLAIRPVAIRSWERFLVLDSDSGWADEARAHLTALRRPRPTYEEASRLLVPGADAVVVDRVVHRYPQRCRGRAQNYILRDWLESGQPADLDLMRKIAAARARLGDPYLLDTVEHAVDNRTAVAAGMREFAAARAAEEKLQWDVAAEYFSRAARLFERAGSPLSIGAAIYAAQGEFSSGLHDAALSRLDRVDKGLKQGGSRYPTMAAESAWVRALILGRTGKPQEALDAYRYALKEAIRGGEIEHAAALSAMVAWMLDIVGDPAEADQYRLESLRRNEEINAAPERMYVSYLDAAWVALRAGRPHLGLALVEALTPIARREGHPLHLAESDAWRALGLLALGERGRGVSHRLRSFARHAHHRGRDARLHTGEHRIHIRTDRHAHPSH
jgi:tetratricopeptide (TPR) repeat protein